MSFNLLAYCSLLVFLTLSFIVCFCLPSFRYRINRIRKRIYIYKWTLWILELAFFPAVLNVVEFSVCPFSTAKSALVLVQCVTQLPFGWKLVLVTSGAAALIAVLYNLILICHLRSERISNMLQEEHVRKKEIEFVVGISEQWMTHGFFAFSSFRSEIFKMYHRPLFNVLGLLLIAAHVLIPDPSPTKAGVLLGIFALYLLYAVASRPYRSGPSNALLIGLLGVLTMNCFMLLLKLSGLKSALFVDSYFYYLLMLVNATGWFLIMAFLLSLLCARDKWSLDKEQVALAVQNQELAIVLIKRARKFRAQIVKTKKYGEIEAAEMEALLESLTEQFNALRDKQPVVMDALLEALDQLKDLKKNIEENPFLYNFDFREELKGLVGHRYRIYEIRNT